MKLKWLWAIGMILGLQAWAEAPKFLEEGETYVFVEPIPLGSFEATVLEIDARSGWVLVRGDLRGLTEGTSEFWLNLNEVLVITPADQGPS